MVFEKISPKMIKNRNIIKNILVKDSIWTREFEVCFVIILFQMLKNKK